MRRRHDDIDPNKLYWWQLAAAAVVAVSCFWPLFGG